MQIDLTRFFKLDKEQMLLDHSFSMESVDVDGFKPFISPITVKGSISSHASSVELVADINYDFSMPCNRCMEEFSSHKTLTVKHLLVKKLCDAYDDRYVEVEDELDLEELIYSDIILDLPIKYICKDDCRGICPQCGANLNIDNCNCNKSEIDPRLEALKALLD